MPPQGAYIVLFEAFLDCRIFAWAEHSPILKHRPVLKYRAMLKYRQYRAMLKYRGFSCLALTQKGYKVEQLFSAGRFRGNIPRSLLYMRSFGTFLNF